jgi:putative ABC transport system permease protein
MGRAASVLVGQSKFNPVKLPENPFRCQVESAVLTPTRRGDNVSPPRCPAFLPAAAAIRAPGPSAEFTMWTLAWKTLLADRRKSAAALVGVVFSITLVNVQSGLFLGLVRKASLLVDYGEADIWVGHRKMHNVDMVQDIPRHWVERARGAPGVLRAEPYLIGWGTMTLPDGGFEALVVVGAERGNALGSAWSMREGSTGELARQDGVIVDAHDAEKLAHPRVGDVREINGHRVRIVGLSEGILGFLVAPYAFTTIDRAAHCLGKPSDVCSYALIQVAPGADVAAVAAEIRRRLPHADVYAQADYSALSIDFWMRRTGLGISFGAATLLGLCVGLVMVAQTLYALVLDRLHEFGTLKALGAYESEIYQFLCWQVFVLTALGSVLGLALTAAIQWAFYDPKAPIDVPWWLAAGSCAAVAAICFLASLAPYFRLRSIDPVIVLQG